MKRTNKEYLLEEIRKETKLSCGAVFDLFKIINQYDWTCFCSQMADYDQPQERLHAKKILDEKLISYQEKDWKKVWNLLKGPGEISKFYNSHFHTMDEEFK